MPSKRAAGAKATSAARTTEMIKANWLAGLLALALFSHAQYQGWSLFDREAGAQTARVAGTAGRGYHK